MQGGYGDGLHSLWDVMYHATQLCTCVTRQVWGKCMSAQYLDASLAFGFKIMFECSISFRSPLWNNCIDILFLSGECDPEEPSKCLGAFLGQNYYTILFALGPPLFSSLVQRIHVLPDLCPCLCWNCFSFFVLVPSAWPGALRGESQCNC